MKRKNFTAEQIIRVLREVDTGSNSVAQTCRRHGISEVTFYRWRKRYQGMNLTEAKRLKKLTAENARLKRMIADRELELDALKEILEKNAERGGTSRSRSISHEQGPFRTAELSPGGD